MRVTPLLSISLLATALAACGGGSNSPRAVPAPPATNNNGSPVTGIITARFDPATAVLPFPTNLLLSGTTDLTLNPPVANPNNFADPAVALSALDGFSTSGPWSMTWSARPNPATLVGGQSIRIFEVTLTGPGGGVTGVVRELAPQEFAVAVAPSDATGRTVAIVPTVPLKQVTSYMAVITEGVTDAAGNDATPDQTYFLAKRTTPICNGSQVLDPLIPPTSCPSLEGLRQLVNSQEAAAASRGIPRSDIVLSWVATTQSITPVLQAVKSTVQPRAHSLVPVGTLGTVSGGLLPPIADVFSGFIELPYYLEAPTSDPQTSPRVLTGFWQANPGAYVPPFNALGLNPTSTNLTYANPFPRVKSTVRVPVLVTVPNAAAGPGGVRPAAGWPVVIFQHGITGNRTQALPLAATLAQAGHVTVAIDLPLHGLPPSSPLHAGALPFGVRERTFDVDLHVNETQSCPPSGPPVCPDGNVDSSGVHFINLGSLLTSRDNLRQAEVDLLSLAATIPQFDFNGGGTDTDGSRISFAGMSLGGIVGAPFVALSDTVNTGFLSVPGGGIARLLDGSQQFGPRIRAGLAAAGVQAGTPAYDQFMLITQTVIDSGDPINYGFITANNAVLLHQVAGDTVVPNAVPGAPLSGTEPMIRVYGLANIRTTTQSASGVRGAVRFRVGAHSSLLDPGPNAAVTVEMQKQAASFLGSGGTAVIVTDTSVIAP